MSLQEHMPVIIALTTCVDQLDKNECDSDSLCASIAVVLKELDYDEVDSYASAVQTTRSIEAHFAQQYYKQQTVVHKFTLFTAAIITAANIIKDGQLDEQIREVAAKTIAEKKHSEL